MTTTTVMASDAVVADNAPPQWSAGDSGVVHAGAPLPFRRRDYGRNHTYFLGDAKIPGVTTIIGDGLPKPALTKWAATCVAEYAADHVHELQSLGGRNAIVGALQGVPWDRLHEAAARGSDVHRLAARLHAGEEVDVPENLLGHVDAYVRFLEQWQPHDERVEISVGSRKHRYAGTFDLLATLRDGRRWLIDAKTSRSGIFPEIALQLAAYRYAEVVFEGKEERPMDEVDCCGALWITPDSYELREVTAGPEQFRTFLYVQQVAQFTKNSQQLLGPAMVAA
jgi:hypothetical protein